MKARFIRMEWENPSRTIASFFFEPIGRYRYEAGQYAVFSIPHADADDRGIERTMTLSSSPLDPLLRISMRLFGDNSSSFKRALIALQPCEEITVYESMGDLVLPLSPSTPLLWIAGGVGIASFVGMAKFLYQTSDKRAVRLLYVVASPDDIVLQDAFTSLRGIGSLTRTIYTPSVNSHKQLQSAGYAADIAPQRMTTADVLSAITPECLIYISGTEHMVSSLRQQLDQAGISSQQIVFDYFDGYVSDI